MRVGFITDVTFPLYRGWKQWHPIDVVGGNFSCKCRFMPFFQLLILFLDQHPYSNHPYFCVHTLNNPSAHPSYSYHYLLSPSTLFFAHPIVLHILLFCTFYIAHFTLISLFFNHIYALVLCYFYIILIFYSSALSTEQDLIWLHFTSSYTLYNLLCDK